MSFFLSAVVFCFIACHAGPADHFSTFANALKERGYTVRVYGSGPALQKFKERHITQVIPFSVDGGEQTVLEIAKECSAQTVIITDVGDPFDLTLQQGLATKASKSLRLAYYDNPESYVPGGYSAIAAQVMRAAQGTLFANAHLAVQSIYKAPSLSIDLPLVQRAGLGYYPIAQAEEIGRRRLVEHQKARTDLFAKYGIKDQGQKILVYIGGNNEEYYSKAFPAFLRILGETARDLHAIVLFQQHPGARAYNRDGALIEQWRQEPGHTAIPLLYSDLNSNEALMAADVMLYSQTSMGPQFVLAGIPTVQVNHAVYPDLLVSHKVCGVATDAQSFLHALQREDTEVESSYEVIRHGLGISTEWLNHLEQSVDHFLMLLTRHHLPQ